MSAEQLTAFWAAVDADASLQEKLKRAGDADAVVAIAKGAGFVISAEELQSEAERQLSEEELEGVAGGNYQYGAASVALRFMSAFGPRFGEGLGKAAAIFKAKMREGN